MLISVYGIVTTETWTVQKKDRQEVAIYRKSYNMQMHV